MELALILAIGMALLFALTNGFLDAANAIATLVATRTARPGQAIALAAVFNLAGPFLLGGAVADTIAKVVTLPGNLAVEAIGAGLSGAVLWNFVARHRNIPSSSSHALVGGLVGVALLAGGPAAVHWGGLEGLRPVGVLGILGILALAPLLGLGLTYLLERPLLRLAQGLSGRAGRRLNRLQWGTSAWLSFAHGSNDSMKSVGIIAALLLASGQAHSLDISPLMILVASGALTLGTALGGWGIVRTVGRGIFPVRQLDGLASQTGSALIILAASTLGAPVSTTQVVSSSVIGSGLARGRWRHIDWQVVRAITTTWLTTMPAAALLGALFLPAWRLLG